LAIQGGISLDLIAMNKIVSLNAEDQTVTVQAGLTRKQLNEQIRATGLFFSDRPGRRCLPWWDVSHACVGHERRALWHDA